MTKPNHQTARRIIEQQIEFLVPGIELAHDICSDDGKILFSQGTILNQQAIKKLSTWGINKVKIIAEVTTNPITDPKVRQFINSYNQSVTVVQKAFDEIRQTQQIPGETFQNFQTTANTITERVMAAGNIIDQLYNLPQCDDYTFRHSVNVSAIAALIATWLKFPPESVSAISLSGLLHDVGKSQLAPRLLNKSSLLSPNPIALTDGRCGRVVCINKNTPSRSMVQLDNGEVLDLDDETDLRIHYIIR
ncbi:MAG: metal dependent phosphohydrolase [Firmicutes bacterium]|nr:metal dependent phosphohydrolase [Bacillota bacterium]